MCYSAPVKANSIRALKKAEGRQRMADLRRARRSRRAALTFERKFALMSGREWRITNLADVMREMARFAPTRK
ncbi:MAG: hypothetical protein C5B50_06255 [Verrucomicrobia bacterium]|nr:MAG: hypothetical protein C5B50_06255 [Verrucomicrobiota bacterium]